MQTKKIIKRAILIILFSLLSYLSFSMINNYSYAYTTYTYSNSTNDLPSNFEELYPGYLQLIEPIAKQHPNWTFKLYVVDSDWYDALSCEYSGHGRSPKNLSPADMSSYAANWICVQCKTKRYDNGSWYCASTAALEYMMDPRNSLNSSDLFQFQDLSSSVADREAIKKMVEGTFIDNDECITAILEAGKENNISPYHLVARIIQEQGKSGSTLGLGISENTGATVDYKIDGNYLISSPSYTSDGTGSSITAEGNTYTLIKLGDVNGDGTVTALDYMKIKNYIMDKLSFNDNEIKAADVNEDGSITALDYMKIKNYIMDKLTIAPTSSTGNVTTYYNLFNIGATGNSKDAVIANGFARAKSEGWTSMVSSIKGGSKFVAENYVARGQNTLYFQKFNVAPVNPEAKYSHQYMQNILAAQNEGTSLRRTYENYGIINNSFVFCIPLYNNMPRTACSRPATNSSTPRYSGEKGHVITDEVRLRSAGTTSSNRVKWLDENEPIIILERASTQVDGFYWDKIVTVDTEHIGYVARNYITTD